MTDKELKKLSRLELLELLLAESRENERLKEELEEAKRENSVEKSARHISETSDKLEAALQKMSSIVEGLGKARESECAPVRQAAAEPAAVKEPKLPTADEQAKPQANGVNEDFDIYKNLLVFFIGNPEGLDVLPEDLRRTVIKRIEEIKGR